MQEYVEIHPLLIKLEAINKQQQKIREVYGNDGDNELKEKYTSLRSEKYKLLEEISQALYSQERKAQS